MGRALLIIIVICFTMCKQQTQRSDAIFVDLNRPEKASVFDYFRSIELIPLETSSNVLLVGVKKLISYQEKYYALDPVQSMIFIFDEAGRFLFKIDRRGQADGDYISIQDFIINPYSGNIEILEPYGAIKIYDLPGNYIETKQIDFPGLRAIHSISAISKDIYVFHSMFQPHKIIYYDLVEEKLLHEEYNESYRLGSFSNIPYQYQNDWFFFRPIDLEVYKLGTKGLEVAFEFDFGSSTRKGTDITFTKESERDLYKSIDEIFNQSDYLIHSVRHNNRYIFASLSIKDMDDRSNVIYDKATGKSKLISEFTEGVLFNSYRMEEIIVTDEYVLMPTQWVDLEKRVRKEMLNDEQRIIFEKLINSEMEENPILIKYWFK